jgi:hypothetical protein
MWVLLIPIILIEATVAVTFLHMNVLQAAQMAGVANLASTLVGIPVTWAVLLILEMNIGKGGGAYGIDTFRGRMLSITLQSAWLVPYRNADWMIPAAELFLCVPFVLMSVWTEYLSADVMLHGSIPASLILTWSWFANTLSYAMIALVLIIILAITLLKCSVCCDRFSGFRDIALGQPRICKSCVLSCARHFSNLPDLPEPLKPTTHCDFCNLDRPTADVWANSGLTICRECVQLWVQRCGITQREEQLIAAEDQDSVEAPTPTRRLRNTVVSTITDLLWPLCVTIASIGSKDRSGDQKNSDR